jgi:hypothetical protein
MADVIECTPVDLSDEQRANLAKLAAYLWTLPADYPDFGMDMFTKDQRRGMGFHAPYAAECGTAACAAGHGPKAGVEPLPGETWRTYSQRAFVPCEDAFNCPAWEWVFAAGWCRTDNTAHGASARIGWMLNHGVPIDASDQRYGDAPLCYSTERAA